MPARSTMVAIFLGLVCVAAQNRMPMQQEDLNNGVHSSTSTFFIVYCALVVTCFFTGAQFTGGALFVGLLEFLEIFNIGKDLYKQIEGIINDSEEFAALLAAGSGPDFRAYVVQMNELWLELCSEIELLLSEFTELEQEYPGLYAILMRMMKEMGQVHANQLIEKYDDNLMKKCFNELKNMIQELRNQHAYLLQSQKNV